MMGRKVTRGATRYDEMGEIKKGPWKVEEDQVLINHVKRYGPRDWSSIRSKGLLRRTGKSCRLRWVNKLRPNLKTGVKFSAEEERIVIDLQAQFGNKWARIATYLQGRTDNDVKNFWSSRQKRLARILQSSAPSSNKPLKISAKEEAQALAFSDVPSLEEPKFKFCSPTEEGESMAKPLSCLSSRIDDPETIKMMPPFQDMVYQSSFSYEHGAALHDYTTEKKPFPEPQPHLAFPQIPQLQPDFPLSLESQDFIARLGEPSFLDEFEHSSGSELCNGQLPIQPSILASDTSCLNAGKAESHDAVDLSSFIDDFPPIDMFDDIEPLPSPSDWS